MVPHVLCFYADNDIFEPFGFTISNCQLLSSPFPFFCSSLSSFLSFSPFLPSLFKLCVLILSYNLQISHSEKQQFLQNFSSNVGFPSPHSFSQGTLIFWGLQGGQSMEGEGTQAPDPHMRILTSAEVTGPSVTILPPSQELVSHSGCWPQSALLLLCSEVRKTWQ